MDAAQNRVHIYRLTFEVNSNESAYESSRQKVFNLLHIYVCLWNYQRAKKKKSAECAKSAKSS